MTHEENDMPIKNLEQLAASAYHAYCKKAGGKTFDGKPLPTWSELGEECQTCWVEAARQVAAEVAALH